MSNKYHSGSDMYKKHRDLIASIMEQVSDFEEELDETHKNDCKCKECKCGDTIEESADHPEDCRCKMCKPSIYEGHDESDYPEEWLEFISKEEATRLMKYQDQIERGEKLGDARKDFDEISDKLTAGYDEIERKKRGKAERASVVGESADHPEDCRCKMCKPSIYESTDEEYLDKAKKEIEDESELATSVAEDNGQIFDNVSHMNWFVQAVADRLKEDSQLDEKDLTMGHISSKFEFKKHIANNFDEYKANIMRLYPADMKGTKEVFLKFLKDQSIDKEKLNDLSKTLSKKIREVGDAYDEMTSMVDMIGRFSK